MNKVLGLIIVPLLIIVGVFAWLLFAPTANAPAVERSTTTAETAPSIEADPFTPLHERVLVAFPKSGSVVGKTFNVLGEASGNWYFEASFPIQVRDANDNVIGRSHANALSNWMTTKQVGFTATVNIDGNYSGPATLILLRDNPSGLPENDDALEISIFIK